MIQNLTQDDVVDILYGATVFGAGGGGELDEGLDLIERAATAGKQFRMIEQEDVPDAELICTPYLLGAISDLPEGAEALVGGTTPPILAAFDRLTHYLGRRVFGAVPCELGGSNTAVPFFVAAMNDAVVVDADPSGRAVPEITHSAYALAGLPVGVIVTTNALGETIVLENIADDQRAEALVRSLAQLSRNDIAAIDHALPARVLRSGLISGTLSRAGRVGALLRRSALDPAILPERIAELAEGTVLFEGVVVESTSRVEGGFTLGRFEVRGTGPFAGQALAVDLKNENMVGWIDGAPVVTIPEIITVMDNQTGQVVTNPNVRPSQWVSVLVLPAPEVFLTPQGLRCFGPSYAGVHGEFRSALQTADD